VKRNSFKFIKRREFAKISPPPNLMARKGCSPVASSSGPVESSRQLARPGHTCTARPSLPSNLDGKFRLYCSPLGLERLVSQLVFRLLAPELFSFGHFAHFCRALFHSASPNETPSAAARPSPSLSQVLFRKLSQSSPAASFAPQAEREAQKSGRTISVSLSVRFLSLLLVEDPLDWRLCQLVRRCSARTALQIGRAANRRRPAVHSVSVQLFGPLSLWQTCKQGTAFPSAAICYCQRPLRDFSPTRDGAPPARQEQ